MRPKLRLLELYLLLLLPACLSAQVNTEWTARSGEWFDKASWSAGVPNLKVPAVIRSGVVTATGSSRLAPATAELTLGESNRTTSGDAQLTVLNSSLSVNGHLTVGSSSTQHAVGSLTTERGSVREAGNVFVGQQASFGVVQDKGVAEAKAQMEGSLLSLNQAHPSLFVGRNLASGTATASAFIDGTVGSQDFGFNSVNIGYADKGTEGRASGLLSVPTVYGGGRNATLNIGVNFGSGHADGQLTVPQGAINFDEVLIGAALGPGTASGELVLGGILQAGQLDLGSENGQGIGQLVLNDGTRLEGKQLTIHPGSELVASFDLGTSVTNNGALSILGSPDASRSSSTKIGGEFTQTKTGVTTFDIAGLNSGTGYEFLSVNNSAELGGRFDLNFAKDFRTQAGQVFDLVQSSSTELNGLVLNPLNLSRDLALSSEVTRSGLRISLVEPELQVFLNPGVGVIEWENSEVWGDGRVPTSVNKLDVMNENAQPQSLVVATDVTVQSLQLGGTTEPMTLILSKNTAFSATEQIRLGDEGAIVLDNASVLTPFLEVTPGSRFSGQGQVVGDISNAGWFQVGTSENPSSLDVEGSFVQTTDGIFSFDVLGDQDGQFDQLMISGSAQINGVININLPDQLGVKAGAQIPIITARGGLSGDLKFRVDSPNLQGFEFGFSSGDGQTMMMFMEEVGPDDVGDLNRDGFVDECDFDAFSLALRDVDAYFDEFDWSPAARGNINDDGEFDVDDIQPFFELIQGVACQPEAAAIPEPSAAVLGWVSLIFLWHCRKHRMGMKRSSGRRI